jgi:hypothetical protein
MAEYIAKFMEQRRQQGLFAGNHTISTSASVSISVPVPVPKDSKALVFPGNIENIGESSRIGDYLATLT